MESLWRFEDKWKLSTQEAVILFVCASSLLLGVCAAATVLKRRTSSTKRNQQLVEQTHFIKPKLSGTSCICAWGGSVKRVLMATVRWSGASKWEEQNVASWHQEGPSPSPLLGKAREGPVGAVGWQSNNSESPVWQRPILMGEKCEMPRFSGLILYDERGQPLHNEPSYVAEIKQEKTPAKGRTTLRDLL
ncbi:unnamed protein product [Rhodiola kirilowii]